MAVDNDGAPEQLTSAEPRVTTNVGRHWLKISNCANKILWGQYEFLKNRKVALDDENTSC